MLTPSCRPLTIQTGTDKASLGSGIYFRLASIRWFRTFDPVAPTYQCHTASAADTSVGFPTERDKLSLRLSKASTEFTQQMFTLEFQGVAARFRKQGKLIRWP
jgi:hypothetical protein